VKSDPSSEQDYSISVVIVCDYSAGHDLAWNQLRRVLAALATQTFSDPFQVILSESLDQKGGFPEDLLEILPSLEVCFFPVSTSYELKNHGVQQARAEWVALLDGDCIPDRDVLRRFSEVVREEPEVVAVSGITTYPGGGLITQVLALLDRSYLDPGRPGYNRFVCGNSPAWRRDVYLKHPLPVNAGAFAARMQSEPLFQMGSLFWFDPEIRFEHPFHGWAMERDLRRCKGHGSILSRKLEPKIPFSWVARLGALGVPILVAGSTLVSLRDCLRCRRHFGVRFTELPVALVLAIVVNLLEVPGMLDAIRGRTLDGTSYR